jgi:hypothetical protein
MIPKSIDAYVQNMCHYEHDLVARGIVECMGRCRIASFSIIYGFYQTFDYSWNQEAFNLQL